METRLAWGLLVFTCIYLLEFIKGDRMAHHFPLENPGKGLMWDCLLYKVPATTVVWTSHIEQTNNKKVLDLLDLLTEDSGGRLPGQMSISVFSLCYVVVAVCFVFKTKEFESAGLTIESFFDRLLGKEHDGFVEYHLRRTLTTRLVHSLLIPGYLFGLLYFYNVAVFELSTIWWSTLVIFSITLPIFVIVFSLTWDLKNGRNHPLTNVLQAFAMEDQTWEDVKREINEEFRTVEKICIRTSNITTIIATTNWVIKLSPYTIDLVRQNFMEMEVFRADTYRRLADGDVMVQYITIKVKCTRPGVRLFGIRMNALDFTDFQNRIRGHIVIVDGVSFRKTTMEVFLDVFNETIQRNPAYEIPHGTEVERCIGCLQNPAGVKLVKHCSGSDQCMNCNCRPLWCADCMGRWFASRQDQAVPETWLRSTCTCPICRSIFCLLDVCPLRVLDS